MKWREIKAIPWRIKLLITRRFTWIDENGRTITDKEDWGSAWAIVGFHTWSWWWVRRWGDLDCGCIRNPLTRRLIVYSSDCTEHGTEFWGD